MAEYKVILSKDGRGNEFYTGGITCYVTAESEFSAIKKAEASHPGYKVCFIKLFAKK